MRQCDKDWIQKLDDLGASTGVRHVDLLFDQVGADVSILPALRVIHPRLEWFSLFSGMPEETLINQAPILMRLHLDEWRHKAWLEEMLMHFHGQPRLVLLLSPMPFPVLAKALQALSQLQWGGLSGILRFHDPRLINELLASVLDASQRQRFLQTALCWSWRNLDQQVVWLPGTWVANQPEDNTSQPLALTDAQYDRLGSISDALQLINIPKSNLPDLSNEQCFALCYQWVLEAGEEHYFGDLHEYAQSRLASISA